MKKKSIREIDRHNEEMSVLSSADRFNRARSVTVGTAFNGVTEIMMRADGKHLWAVLGPSEVIELIHQLAANVGCHIHIQPRNDFASWRQWNEVKSNLPEQTFFSSNNHPPLSDTSANSNYVQAQIAQKGAQNETVATEKPKHRRSAKRTAVAA